MRLGPFDLKNNVFLAPMAGITDRPFRELCLRLGAGLAVAEMTSANPALRHTRKSALRADHGHEAEPRAVQIAGSDPVQMADYARYNVDRGAQVIDINMGCPAKKVCGTFAGSALLRDEALVGRILDAVVAAVDVPVTLKLRTGWDHGSRNALAVVRIAEAAGIAMLTLHGRTRADRFQGAAEYDTIRAVKAAVSIPVVANGDITTPAKARRVLDYTGADAVMIGRGAQGRPWLLREIDHYLRTGVLPPPPSREERLALILGHIGAVHAFYKVSSHDPRLGVRIARKHIQWYTQAMPGFAVFWQRVSPIEDAQAQLRLLDAFLQGADPGVPTRRAPTDHQGVSAGPSGSPRP
jgi:tRNA-dihydrouridine synthase B